MTKKFIEYQPVTCPTTKGSANWLTLNKKSFIHIWPISKIAVSLRSKGKQSGMLLRKKYICLMFVFVSLFIKRTLVYELETTNYYSIKITKIK